VQKDPAALEVCMPVLDEPLESGKCVCCGSGNTDRFLFRLQPPYDLFETIVRETSVSVAQDQRCQISFNPELALSGLLFDARYDRKDAYQGAGEYEAHLQEIKVVLSGP
jgi:hypothetical protein